MDGGGENRPPDNDPRRTGRRLFEQCDDRRRCADRRCRHGRRPAGGSGCRDRRPRRLRPDTQGLQGRGGSERQRFREGREVRLVLRQQSPRPGVRRCAARLRMRPRSRGWAGGLLHELQDDRLRGTCEAAQRKLYAVPSERDPACRRLHSIADEGLSGKGRLHRPPRVPRGLHALSDEPRAKKLWPPRTNSWRPLGTIGRLQVRPHPSLPKHATACVGSSVEVTHRDPRAPARTREPR
jgi:hypothetical protein